MKLTILSLFLLFNSFFCTGQCNNQYNSFGSTGYDYIDFFTVDSAGNIYVLGYFSDSLFVSNSIIHSTFVRTVFIAKFSSNNTLEWLKPLYKDLQSLNSTKKIFLDINEDPVVVTNSYLRLPTDSFDTIPNAFPNGDLFIARLDKNNGQLLSYKNFGNRGNSYISDVKFNSSNEIYLAGFYNDTISINSTQLISSIGTNTFIVKFNQTLDIVWAKQFGNSGLQNSKHNYPGEILLYNDRLYIVGFYDADCNFGQGFTLQNNQGNQYFVGLDTSGTTLFVNHGDYGPPWGKIFLDSQNNLKVILTDIYSFDLNGNLLSTHSFRGSRCLTFNNDKFYFAIGFRDSVINSPFYNPGFNLILGEYDTTGALLNYIYIPSSDSILPFAMESIGSTEIAITGVYAGPDTINHSVFLPKYGFSVDYFVFRICNSILTINEQSKKNNYTLYPNPSISNTTILAKGTASKPIYYKIFSTTGQLVQEANFENNYQINHQLLAKGFYLVLLYLDDGEFSTLRMIKSE